MTFVSACDLLATEGARDAIANGREVRALEDRELAPLKQEMNDLWTLEIQPREEELEELRYQLQVLEEDLLRPLREAQGDAWAPGGEASEMQLVFDARYRELELLQRAIEVEQRELDTNWQNIWNGGDVDPEFQVLEDLRFEKQRELERLYRFGYRPIDDIWDEINDLNSNQNWASTGSQIESEEINVELRRLYDLQRDIQNSGSERAKQIENQARTLQDELQNLHNNGWNPINEIYSEIERLESQQGFDTAGSGNSDSIANKIAELEALKLSYAQNRENELESLRQTLAALEAEDVGGDSQDDTISDNSARIAELEQAIVELEAELVGLAAAKYAELDSLNTQINEKQVAYDQLVEIAESDFQVLSASLLAAAVALDEEISGIASDSDGAADQIANLEAQKAALIAQEEAEEAAMHEAAALLVAEREAGVVELQAVIDDIEELLAGGLTDDIDAQITAYNAELDILRAAPGETVIAVSITTSSVDIQANIEAAKSYWDGQINEIVVQIADLRNQLDATSATNDAVNERIRSLKLQVVEAEQQLNNRTAQLEAQVNELWQQVNNAGSGDPDRMAEVQSQIGARNAELEAIWQRESSQGLNILRTVQELEKKARALEEELEQQTRLLEEELWDLDDQLSLFYKDRDSVNRDKQTEYEGLTAEIQQRRQDIEAQRWVIQEEQRTAMDLIEAKQQTAGEEIKRIEAEEFGAIRGRMRELELELKGFRVAQRELEQEMNVARRLVEEKKRELEDKVFDALEEAAGIEGAEELLAPKMSDSTVPEESSLPEIDEGDGSTN